MNKKVRVHKITDDPIPKHLQPEDEEVVELGKRIYQILDEVQNDPEIQRRKEKLVKKLSTLSYEQLHKILRFSCQKVIE